MTIPRIDGEKLAGKSCSIHSNKVALHSFSKAISGWAVSSGRKTKEAPTPTTRHKTSTMPPQLFRRIRALSPNDNVEDEGAFDDYKEIMEEIKREHPDLPPSVQQQMAVKKLSSMKERRSSQTQSNLMAAMSNFRFGRGNKATGDLTTNSDDTDEPVDRRRALNPRVSVKRIDLTQSILEIPSDGDNSLEDSLLNIEASAALAPTPKRQSSRRVVRRDSQKRASLNRSSTELLNVQEDEELLNASIPESLANSKDRTQNSDQDSKSTKNRYDPHKSISDELPDEIKVALGKCDNDDGQLSLGSHERSEGRRRSRVHDSMRSSNASSFLSVDSANFEGDFSAWGSKSSK